MRKIYHSRYLIFASQILFFCLLSFSVKAELFPLTGTFYGSNEVPANASTATGTIHGVYDDATNTLYFSVTFDGLTAGTSAAHFHGPVLVPNTNAGVAIGFAGFPTGVTSGTYNRSFVLTDVQEDQLKAGQWYANIHNATYPGGEIRAPLTLGAASASIYTFSESYSGSQEVPVNTSTATGNIMGVYNTDNNMIFYTINFSGLSANTVAAHFHSPALPGRNVGVAQAHTGFPTGVTSGTYYGAHTITDLRETQLLGGLFYSNIHTSNFPGGEIRAQIFFDAPFVAPTITCPANIVQDNDTDECSALVSFAATATGSPDPTITYWLNGTEISSPYEFPVGSHTVTALAINGGGYVSCTFMVTVNDVQPPVISNISANPKELWPPNHKMKDVAVSYTTSDNCPGVINCQLSITSDEPANSTGDGNTEEDWVVVDDHNVQLRAERKGNGDGRTYSITITCTDQYGNASSEVTTVHVPHDQGKKVSVAEGGRMLVNVSPNPTQNHFILTLNAPRVNEPVNINIVDQSGRLVESRTNLLNAQNIQLGSNYKPGLYFVEVKQGGKSETVKMLKLKN